MRIKSDQFRETIGRLHDEGYTYLVKITAVDWKDRLEALYFLRDLSTGKEETVRFDLPLKAPKVPTIIHLYMAADWYERELSEMFGIEILGRDAKRLLLEKWDGKDPPLRKAFEWSKPYQGMEPVKFAEKYNEPDKKGKKGASKQNVIKIDKPFM